jgi:hypothetical protein
MRLDVTTIPKHMRKVTPYILKSFKINSQISSAQSLNETKPFMEGNEWKTK